MPHTEPIQPTSTGNGGRRRRVSNFQSRVEAHKAELERESTEAERQRTAQEQRRQRMQRLIEEKQRRDADHIGNDPRTVWGNEAARLCEDFLDYMRSRDFPMSTTLEEHEKTIQEKFWGTRVEKRLAWSMRGYLVGVTDLKPIEYTVGDKNVQSYVKGAGVHPVFLCEDGLLREEVLVPPAYKRNTKYQGLSIDFETGQIVTCMAGFLESYNHATNPTEKNTTDYAKRFKPKTLESILLDYAAGIDPSGS